MDPDGNLTRSQKRTARLRGAASRQVATNGLIIQTPKAAAIVDEIIRESARQSGSSSTLAAIVAGKLNTRRSGPADTPTAPRRATGSKRATHGTPTAKSGPSPRKDAQRHEPQSASSKRGRSKQRRSKGKEPVPSQSKGKEPVPSPSRSKKGKEPMPTPTSTSRKRRADAEPPVEKMPPPPAIPRTRISSRKGKEPMHPMDHERLMELHERKKQLRAMMAVFKYGMSPKLQEKVKDKKGFVVPVFRPADPATCKARREKVLERRARRRQAGEKPQEAKQNESTTATTAATNEPEKPKEKVPRPKIKLNRMDIALFVIRQQIKIMRDRINEADEYSLQSRQRSIKLLNHLNKTITLEIASRMTKGKTKEELEKQITVTKTRLTKKQNQLLRLRQERIEAKIEIDQLRDEYIIASSKDRAFRQADQFLYDVDDLRKQQYEEQDDDGGDDHDHSNEAGPSNAVAPTKATATQPHDPVAHLLVKTTSILPLVSSPGFLNILRNFNSHLESVEASLDDAAAAKSGAQNLQNLDDIDIDI